MERNIQKVNIFNAEDKIELEVKSIFTRKKCPDFEQECRCIHDSHTRRIQDTPIHNKETWIHLKVREFECTNEDCEMTTFTEEVPFAGKNQVTSYYLQYYIVTLAIDISSSAIFSNDITKLEDFTSKYSEDIKSFFNGLKRISLSLKHDIQLDKP